jgi:hypothetical protein
VAGSTKTWQMTQAFEVCGEASPTCFVDACCGRMTSDARQLEHGARGVPPFALHSTLCLAALAALAACRPSQPSSPTRNVSTAAVTVPDFRGAAEPIASLSSCPHILTPDLRSPFSAGPSSTSLADYKLVGCWQGTLEGKTFILEEFFSSELGGGIAVQYGGALVAHQMTGAGPPAIVRFTGEHVCIAEKAGAYFAAMSLRTGSRMDDEAAQRVCPPTQWPPAYVLGLGGRHYPVDWHTTSPH